MTTIRQELNPKVMLAELMVNFSVRAYFDRNKEAEAFLKNYMKERRLLLIRD